MSTLQAPNYPDPGRCWDIVDKYKVTIFYTAPTLVRSLMRDGDEARNMNPVLFFIYVDGDCFDLLLFIRILLLLCDACSQPHKRTHSFFYWAWKLIPLIVRLIIYQTRFGHSHCFELIAFALKTNRIELGPNWSISLLCLSLLLKYNACH